MANFGLAGIVGASVALGLFLIAMDTVSRGKPALLTVTLGGIGMWSLINSGLLTSLLTHGLVLMLLPDLADAGRTPARQTGSPAARRARHVRAPQRRPTDLSQGMRHARGRGVRRHAHRPRRRPGNGGRHRFVSLGEASGRLTRMLVMPLRVLRAARHVHADLYHLHDPELLPLAIVFKLFGLRVVYDAHEDLPRQIAYKPYIPGWARRPLALTTGALEQGAARVLDGVVAATPRIAARFPAGKVTLVQNFPLSSEFAAGPSRPYEERRRSSRTSAA